MVKLAVKMFLSVLSHYNNAYKRLSMSRINKLDNSILRYMLMNKSLRVNEEILDICIIPDEF